MPTSEQHSWLQSAFGVVGDLAQSGEDAVSGAAEAASSPSPVVAGAVGDAVSSVVETVADTTPATAAAAVSAVVETAQTTVSAVVATAETNSSTIVETAENAGSDLAQAAADAGQADSGATDAGGASPCNESPTFTVSSPVPVDVLADSVVEFNNRMNAALGGNPHMQPKFGWNFEVDPNWRVTKANLTVDTQIVRPRWSGGRPSDKERALINKAVELIKAHEERHRDIAKAAMSVAVCATHGKTEAAATKALNDAFKKMDQAQNDLDAAEGRMSIVLDGNGQPADVVLVGVQSP